jgi:hypothetical protein
MRSDPSERLFGNEAEFVHALARLMEANPSFSDIALDAILGSRAGEADQRLGRADIIAVRHKQNSKQEALLIECKSRPLYGLEVDRALDQVLRYGALRPSARLVLALPGQLAEEDAVRVRSRGIELWDLAALGAIFKSQLDLLAPPVALAFSSVADTPAAAFIKELRACDPGKKMWSIYQDLTGRILEHCFCPPAQSVSRRVSRHIRSQPARFCTRKFCGKRILE